MTLDSIVCLDKSIFDNSVFWSAKNGAIFKVKKIILITLNNNPSFENIAKLYYLFSKELIEQAIVESKEFSLSKKIRDRIDRAYLIFEEINDNEKRYNSTA